MNANPLRKLESFGQSIWTDFISREMIEGGGLQMLIRNDGVSGVTSNPSIFEKAIAESHEYDASIRDLARQGKSVEQIYEILTVEEIQRTADLLRPTYERLAGMDGLVSLEVSPKLADDTEGTITEARRLWKGVSRPNVMIKVPATKAGLPAIRQLIRDGININITLLFGLTRYREVVDAYLSGLELRAEGGEKLQGISSVASFFLSRIDVLVDPMLESETRVDDPDVELASSLRGESAILSAKLAYRNFAEWFGGGRFRKLAGLGAQKQRLLWASTSTKNPKYSDVRYVEPLIGPETINTLPLETLNAYRDHGRPKLTLTRNVARAQRNMESLKQLGFDLEKVGGRLEKEGVEKFIKSYEFLLTAIRQKASEASVKGVA
jgi:transaldolase